MKKIVQWLLIAVFAGSIACNRILVISEGASERMASARTDRDWLISRLQYSCDEERKVAEVLRQPGVWHLHTQLECDSCGRPVSFWFLGDVPLGIDGGPYGYDLEFFADGSVKTTTYFVNYEWRDTASYGRYRWRYDLPMRKLLFLYQTSGEVGREYTVIAVGKRTLLLEERPTWNPARHFLSLYLRD